MPCIKNPSRTTRIPFAASFLMVTLLGVRSMNADQDATPTRQESRKLVATKTFELEYLLYLPKDYDSQEAWPLMLFLHGAGERGDDLSRVAIHGPPKLVEQGRDFPFVIVSPQCKASETWESIELSKLLDQVIAEHKIDEQRIYVTGLSMGGYGTWDLACYEPHRFAAIAPICGGGKTWLVGKLQDLPVWAFHGAKDNVVPLEKSQELIDKLESMGHAPKLTVYPDLQHDSWTVTYENPELYEWFLSHTRRELALNDANAMRTKRTATWR